jgi:hypothetical protein
MARLYKQPMQKEERVVQIVYLFHSEFKKMVSKNWFYSLFIAPGEIRTPDHLVRSQILYPTELRARILNEDNVFNISNNMIHQQ